MEDLNVHKSGAFTVSDASEMHMDFWKDCNPHRAEYVDEQVNHRVVESHSTRDVAIYSLLNRYLWSIELAKDDLANVFDFDEWTQMIHLFPSPFMSDSCALGFAEALSDALPHGLRLDEEKAIQLVDKVYELSPLHQLALAETIQLYWALPVEGESFKQTFERHRIKVKQ